MKNFFTMTKICMN